jgi:exopolysaccharide biosynthesis protein
VSHVLSLAFCCLALWLPQLEAQSWERIAEDLEMIRLDLEPNSLFSAELLLLRSELKRFAPRVVTALQLGKKLATAEEFAEKSRAVVTINANFFDENSRALGLVVTNGSVQQQTHLGGSALTGIFQLIASGAPNISIVHRQDFSPKKVLEAFQAGPRLLAHGQALRVKDTSSSRRAGICIDASGKLVLFATSGFFGATLTQVQQLLRNNPVNCQTALNLDGGGSAQLFLSGKRVGSGVTSPHRAIPDINIQGVDSVPVVLALVPTEESLEPLQ